VEGVAVDCALKAALVVFHRTQAEMVELQHNNTTAF